jgi:small subunit ribosomal protein S13
MAEQKSQEKKENFRYFVRIANTDLDGNKPIAHALKKIKGISFMFSNMICNLAGIDQMTKAGYLNDEEIKKLDDVLNSPLKYNVPSWMLNRRKNYEDGKDYHIFAGNLSFAEDTDIKRMKKTRSYKGVRHGQGLPVRGQRTKSNFRKNKGKASLGVAKKAGSKAGRV